MAFQGIPSHFFKKVAVSERKNIFRELPQKQASMFIKNEEGIYIFVAKDYAEDKILWLDYTEQSKNAVVKEEALLNFSLDDDRYFMASAFILEKNRIGIRCDQDLFILQRRNNFRVELPESYSSMFNILSINEKAAFIEMKVEDFSAGGMRMFETRDPITVKEGDVIKGTLKMGARTPMQMEAEVKHISSKEIKGAAKVVLGVEFLKVDKMMEGRLMTMVASLQQDVAGKK